MEKNITLTTDDMKYLYFTMSKQCNYFRKSSIQAADEIANYMDNPTSYQFMEAVGNFKYKRHHLKQCEDICKKLYDAIYHH